MLKAYLPLKAYIDMRLVYCMFSFNADDMKIQNALSRNIYRFALNCNSLLNQEIVGMPYVKKDFHKITI